MRHVKRHAMNELANYAEKRKEERKNLGLDS